MDDFYTSTTYELENYEQDLLYKLNCFELNLFNQNYKIIKNNYYNNNDELHSRVYKNDEIYCKITHYYSNLNEFCMKYFKEDKPMREEWYMLDKLSSIKEYDFDGNPINIIDFSPFETKEYSEYNYQTKETYLLRDEEVEMYLT